MTVARTQALRVEASTSANWPSLALIEAALAPSESSDETGEILRDHLGTPVTRTQGRAHVAELPDPGVNGWYEAAMRYGAPQAELLHLAGLLDAAAVTGGASWADRARDCRFRAERCLR